jgi:hypothetical protein
VLGWSPVDAEAAPIWQIHLAFEGLLEWQKATNPAIKRTDAPAKSQPPAAKPKPQSPAARTASQRNSVSARLAAALRSRAT